MKTKTNGTEPVYHISLPKTFKTLLEAQAYMKEYQLPTYYEITYFIPQPQIPIWVIRILKFLNLYSR